MSKSIFNGIFDLELTKVVRVSDFLLCVLVSLVLGMIIAISYMYKSNYTKSFVTTIALLPSIVCVVIMMVNGNVGTGVAVAGAFSLVRFRSVPGTAKEIGIIFLAMSAGLMTGMGYLGYALLFTIIISVLCALYSSMNFGKKSAWACKRLRIVIPENLDYTGIFDEIFNEYLSSYELLCVKTTNMGSMFKLTYDVKLKDVLKEKEMVDKLRCRNGNLEISLSKITGASEEL